MARGRSCSNDVVLLHRLAMCRVNSLLGVCGLLLGTYTQDEEYEAMRHAIKCLGEVKETLAEILPYDAPMRAEGIF